MKDTKPKPVVDEMIGKKHRRLRHIVEKDKDGKPMDKCLCGYIWDVYPITYDPDSGVCQECVDEHQRRVGGNN